ncbi:hypothetical protein CDL12_03526 [Handroanthus impetiginosus]|uniref:Uncharacterized protein n=1 Tax=Handroanthus impetiginosus TaxID=429701 RepID=A0A2G9I1V9_9LAMI|nr:hypothetical protein CDL12_03526 [Handroanthus impetiginosus]
MIDLHACTGFSGKLARECHFTCIRPVNLRQKYIGVSLIYVLVPFKYLNQ